MRKRHTVPLDFAPEWSADTFAQQLIDRDRKSIRTHTIKFAPYPDRTCWTLIISIKQYRFLRALVLRGHNGYSRYRNNWQPLAGTLPNSGYHWSLTLDYIGGTDKTVLRIDPPTDNT